MHTLVLNAHYGAISLVPVSAVSWQDAIKLVVMGTVSVVHEYDDWEVRSPSVHFKVPAVVATHTMHKINRSMPMTRDSVMLRDRYRCQYCGDEKRDLTLDHVLPRAMGGPTTWTNVVAACLRCNSTRGTNVSIQPKVAPWRPSYYQMAAIRKTLPLVVPHPAWNDYLGFDSSLVRVNAPQGISGMMAETRSETRRQLRSVLGMMMPRNE